MLKAVKSNKVVPTIETTKIRVSYNGEKCYKYNPIATKCSLNAKTINF